MFLIVEKIGNIWEQMLKTRTFYCFTDICQTQDIQLETMTILDKLKNLVTTYSPRSKQLAFLYLLFYACHSCK